MAKITSSATLLRSCTIEAGESSGPIFIHRTHYIIDSMLVLSQSRACKPVLSQQRLSTLRLRSMKMIARLRVMERPEIWPIDIYFSYTWRPR
jgi:hypothetical protein